MKNNIFTGVVLTLIACGFLALVFCVGPSFVEAAYEPAKIPDTSTGINTGFNPSVQSRVTAIQTIEYVETPVTKVEYIDRVEKISVELRNFNTLDELKRWLESVNTNITTIYLEHPDVTVDCDDFALALQRKALADGYMLSFQIIETGTYNSLFEGSKMPPSTIHAINLAVIGNNAYYIEPQTSEVVIAACID